MLPILATIGTGLLSVVYLFAYLIFWGFSISIGFWIGKHLTNRMDDRTHSKWANQSFKRVQRLFKREQIAGAATA